MSDVVPLRPSVCWLQDPPGLTHLVIQSVISLWSLRPFWACEVSAAPQHRRDRCRAVVANHAFDLNRLARIGVGWHFDR